MSEQTTIMHHQYEDGQLEYWWVGDITEPAYISGVVLREWGRFQTGDFVMFPNGLVIELTDYNHPGDVWTARWIKQ